MRQRKDSILVGSNADTYVGRLISEDDNTIILTEDGTFYSLGSYYLWLNSNIDMVRFVSYQAGLRLLQNANAAPGTVLLTDSVIRKLHKAVYMKLAKFEADSKVITQSKIPLIPANGSEEWFKVFIAAFNALDNRT